MLVMPNDVIAVFGNAVMFGKMFLQSSSRFIHRVRIPGRIAGKTFMLGADHPFIPTTDMPCIIRFEDGFGDFTGWRISARVLLAIDEIIDTRRNTASVEIRNGGPIIAFHVVDNDKLVT